MRNRAFAAAGVIAAGVVVFAATRGGNDDTSSEEPTRRGGIASAIPLRRAPHLAPGIEHRYAVTMNHASTSSEGAPFALGVDGEWALGVVAGSSPITVRAELRDAHITLRGVRSPNPRATAPYTFTLTDDGRLIALQFPRDLDHDTRTLLTALTATAQLADGGVANAWSAIETDSLGAYDASYQRTGATIAKTKLAYRKTANDEALSAKIVDSKTAIAMRDDGWPDTIEQREELSVGFDKITVTVAGTTTLRHVGTANLVAIAPLGLESVAVNATSTASRDQADRELLDGATLVDLLATMASVRDDGNASAHTYLRLVALFRLDPDATRAAGHQLLGGKLDPREATAMIGALGEAGTPIAQQALVDVVDSSTVTSDQRAAGALSLGLTEAPLPATIAQLETASKSTDANLSSTATLALGNAALRLANSDAAAAGRQVDELLARLARTTEIPERVIVIRALGNTGDPRILPALEAEIASDGDMVRAAAVESLRMVPDGRADALVIATLDDRSSIVRSAAVFAASYRRLDPVAHALAVRARIDDDVSIRRAIVELAGQRMNELPALLRPIVVHAAEADGDAELRALAKQYLG